MMRLNLILFLVLIAVGLGSVSYTHLDVYKRQRLTRPTRPSNTLPYEPRIYWACKVSPRLLKRIPQCQLIF